MWFFFFFFFFVWGGGGEEGDVVAYDVRALIGATLWVEFCISVGGCVYEGGGCAFGDENAPLEEMCLW